VPSITLPDLDGNPARLPELRGEPTVLLFWNNGCGFCRAMIPDLRAWEADKPAGSLRLIVISSGDIEQNRGLQLRSRILLDNEQQVARRFGANGTPMAILLDDQARVASAVAAGAQAVLDLARGPSTAKDAIEPQRAKGNGAVQPTS
jgi:thiol-disulfide isomerase/thioredoxin